MQLWQRTEVCDLHDQITVVAFSDAVLPLFQQILQSHQHQARVVYQLHAKTLEDTSDV